MTMKNRVMEIPILDFGPLLWPNHFIVLNFAHIIQDCLTAIAAIRV